MLVLNIIYRKTQTMRVLLKSVKNYFKTYGFIYKIMYSQRNIVSFIKMLI